MRSEYLGCVVKAVVEGLVEAWGIAQSVSPDGWVTIAEPNGRTDEWPGWCIEPDRT